jgi:hypothetical protein
MRLAADPEDRPVNFSREKLAVEGEGRRSPKRKTLR